MISAGVPDWVKDAVQTKINRADIGFVNKGCYEIFVERGECGRFGCDIEVWRATIDAETFDEWDNEIDPTKQREPITWKEFNIEQL